MSPAPACPSFALIESQIDRVAARMRNAPVQNIVLVRLVKTLSAQLGHHLGQKVRPHGINEVGFRTLTMLYAQLETGINPSDLSDASGETRTNMTRICDELVRKGLIRRRASKEDRRRIVLEMTKKGVALHRKAAATSVDGRSETSPARCRPPRKTRWNACSRNCCSHSKRKAE